MIMIINYTIPLIIILLIQDVIDYLFQFNLEGWAYFL